MGALAFPRLYWYKIKECGTSQRELTRCYANRANLASESAATSPSSPANPSRAFGSWTSFGNSCLSCDSSNPPNIPQLRHQSSYRTKRLNEVTKLVPSEFTGGLFIVRTPTPSCSCARDAIRMASRRAVQASKHPAPDRLPNSHQAAGRTAMEADMRSAERRLEKALVSPELAGAQYKTLTAKAAK